MGKTICFINQKGGCGKSSTCFHLAGAFAEHGLQVLLVDADPQGSLSQGFFGSQVVEGLESDRTLAGAFDGSFAFQNPMRTVRSTDCPQISVVPANHLLTGFNSMSNGRDISRDHLLVLRPWVKGEPAKPGGRRHRNVKSTK